MAAQVPGAAGGQLLQHAQLFARHLAAPRGHVGGRVDADDVAQFWARRSTTRTAPSRFSRRHSCAGGSNRGHWAAGSQSKGLGIDSKCDPRTCK